MNSRTLQTNGTTLHYLDSATDGPVLLLTHGLTANAHAFDGLIAAGLADNLRVISVDLRGRGLSDKPATGYTMADHAADLIGLMDALGLVDAIVGGHSFGGLLTFYIAHHYSDRVTKLVILDAAAQLHPQTRKMLIPAIGRLGKTVASFDAYIAQIKSAPYMTTGWDDAMTSYYRADVEALPDGSVRPRSSPDIILEAITKGSFGEVWPDIIRSVQQPTLLVNGRDDYALAAPLLPANLAMETVGMMSNCRYVAVPGNHQTMLYGPGADQLTKGAFQNYA